MQNNSTQNNFINLGEIIPNFCPSTINPCAVMVKSYAGEPAKLWAIEDMGSSVLVYGTDKRKPIGYPKQFVYIYDKSTFESLSAAFSLEDGDEVERLWSNLIAV